MKSFYKVAIEAIVVGISTVIMGILISILLRPLKVDLPDVCAQWNKNHIMEINLFSIGVALHLLFEYTGINEWYVQNYYK
jgi:hypothetical protein